MYYFLYKCKNYRKASLPSVIGVAAGGGGCMGAVALRIRLYFTCQKFQYFYVWCPSPSPSKSKFLATTMLSECIVSVKYCVVESYYLRTRIPSLYESNLTLTTLLPRSTGDLKPKLLMPTILHKIVKISPNT